jgi:hypothetical protein
MSVPEAPQAPDDTGQIEIGLTLFGKAVAVTIVQLTSHVAVANPLGTPIIMEGPLASQA